MVTRHPFVIYAIGEPEASIIGIMTMDRTTGISYAVYPGGIVPKCTPDGLTVAFGAQNIGAMDGTLYGRILGPGGVVLFEGTPQWCHAGDYVYWEPILTMPSYDLALEVEVSDTPTYAVSEKISFTLGIPGILPAELSLPVIAAAAIAIADLALIGYYLATNPPKT